jgi:hypothetical protein
MRRLAPILALLTMIATFVPADQARALPLGRCHPPPWFRDFDPRSFPIVCGDWWWWPRYHYFASGPHYRRYDGPR